MSWISSWISAARARFTLVACCCAVGLLAVAATTRATAADDLLAIQSAAVGFDGVYKAGYWTQFLIEVKAGSARAVGRLDLQTEDGDGAAVIYPGAAGAELDLEPGKTAKVRLYAKAGPQRSSWQLLLRDVKTDDLLWSERLDVKPPQRATRELLVAVGADAGVALGAGLVKRPEEVSFLAATVKQAADLPDRVWGYDGVERIVLIAGKSALVSELKPEQRFALEQWVLLGGKLILSVGDRGEELLAADQPLAKFLPGRFAGLDPLRETSGLAQFAGVDFPRRAITDANRPRVVQIQQPAGRVELEQGGAGNPPLVIRQPYGLGQVIFVTVELDHAALVAWSGHGRLFARLLQLGGPAADNLAAEQERSLTHLGYDDLVGQLRAVLDQFPCVTVVSFTAAAMVAVALLLLIGPADYFLIRYFRLPIALTWFTFPLVCLVFLAGTWYLGQLAHGRLIRVNQMEVVDVDATRGLVRGTLWTHLYDPRGGQRNLALNVASSGQSWQQVQGIADWQGLPGSGLGGLASPQITMDSAPPYSIAPGGRVAAIYALPMRTASSKALSARWWGQTDIAKDISPITTNAYGHLEGEISNPFPFELTDCLIANGEWLYRIEAFGPGQKLNLNTLTALNLEARLTRRKVIDTKDLSTPWEPDDRDLTRIMQMLMLHDAVRGPTYTRMSHRYQPQIDLSEHIRLGRAVLMGRAAAPAATLQLHDAALEGQQSQPQAQSWTWYRLIIPVQSRDHNMTAQR